MFVVARSCVCVCVCIRVRLYAIARPNPLAHVNSTQRTMYARLFSKRVDLKENKEKVTRMTMGRSRGTWGSDDNVIPFPPALADVEAGGIEADGNKVSEAAGMFRRPALLARILPLCDNSTVRSLQQL